MLEVEQTTERLSDKNPCNDCKLYSPCTSPCGKWHEWNRNVLQKLAEYETAEEEGRLVVLPCKIGDTIYIIRDECDFPYDCYQARTCNECEYRNLYVDEEAFGLIDIVTNLRLFGNTIFLSREEAEEALKEMEG